MPATPTISAANNHDGSIAVEVFGTAPGASNTVYWSRFGGNWEDATPWVEGGSRTGDGVIAVTNLPFAGVYLVIVRSESGGNSVTTLPAHVYVSTGVPDPATALIDLVKARVVSLSLQGIPENRVFDHTFLDDFYARSLQEPCVLIGLQGPPVYLGESRAPTNRDAFLYPVLVSAAAPADQSQRRRDRELWFGWKYRIMAALTAKGFLVAGADFSVVSSRVVPGAHVNPRWWSRNAWTAPDVFQFEVWQPRGII